MRCWPLSCCCRAVRRRWYAEPTKAERRAKSSPSGRRHRAAPSRRRSSRATSFRSGDTIRRRMPRVRSSTRLRSPRPTGVDGVTTAHVTGKRTRPTTSMPSILRPTASVQPFRRTSTPRAVSPSPFRRRTGSGSHGGRRTGFRRQRRRQVPLTFKHLLARIEVVAKRSATTEGIVDFNPVVHSAKLHGMYRTGSLSMAADDLTDGEALLAAWSHPVRRRRIPHGCEHPVLAVRRTVAATVDRSSAHGGAALSAASLRRIPPGSDLFDRYRRSRDEIRFDSAHVAAADRVGGRQTLSLLFHPLGGRPAFFSNLRRSTHGAMPSEESRSSNDSL